MNMKKHSSSGLLGSVRKQSCHHSGAFHPTFADHASDRDHVLGLAALEVEEPDRILPRLVLRSWPQGLRVVDGLSGEDGDVVGVDLDSLEAVLNTLRQ